MLRIFDILFPPREDEVVLRGISDDDFISLLAPKLVVATHPETIALFSFSNIHVRSAIHEVKYHDNSRAKNLLALSLAEYLSDADDVGPRRSYIVPVPLGAKRMKERGFNQVEQIAILASKTVGIPINMEILKRTRETVSQVSLCREKREENMRGAFGATQDLDPTYTYIVLDDVVTTGATLQAAIDALTSAGAINIIPLALAH